MNKHSSKEKVYSPAAFAKDVASNLRDSEILPKSKKEAAVLGIIGTGLAFAALAGIENAQHVSYEPGNTSSESTQPSHLDEHPVPVDNPSALIPPANFVEIPVSDLIIAPNENPPQPPYPPQQFQ